MQYRRLGRTGLQVSELGLGAGALRASAEDYAVRLVRRALDLGVNYFDTASVYGDSEAKLGLALEGERRQVVLATKLDAVTADDAERELATSLRRLRTDYVDVLQIHDIRSLEDLDRRTASGSVWDTLLRAKADGRARFLGMSAHRHDVLVEAMRRFELDAVLFIMNFLETEATRELIPLALGLDVGLVVMKPLAMGLLPPRLALRFLLTQPISTTIPGAGRIDWLETNCAASDSAGALSAGEQAELERLRSELGPTRCRLCYRCEPCPLGVSISYTLGTYRFFNDFRNLGPAGMRSFPWGEWAREHLPEELAAVTAGAERCDSCGECEPRCPYHLPIARLLKGTLPTLHEMGAAVSAW